MGASRSRKPGRRRAWRSCKPPRGGAGALGLPRGEANSFAACLSFPWGKDRPPSLQSEGGLGWHEKVACGQGDCLPDALATFSCHQGAALVYPLQLALQLEGVAGSRRRRGGDGHPAQTGGRHKRPWFRPRCWGRLGEGRRGPSPGRLVCSSEQSRLGSSRKRELPGLWVPGSRQDRSRPIATHAQSSRGGSEGGRALPPRAYADEVSEFIQNHSRSIKEAFRNYWKVPAQKPITRC